jgi:uncharacterized membrane protein YGL010W
VVLALSLWRVPVGGYEASLAMLLAIPALIGWLVLDAGIGLAMIAPVAVLLLLAERMSRFMETGGTLALCTLAIGAGALLLFVGHAHYEKRKPAFADDLFQMMIGPMFITAKALVALGLRPDLAAAITPAVPSGTASAAHKPHR